MIARRARLPLILALLLLIAAAVAAIVHFANKPGGIPGAITALAGDTKKAIEQWCGQQLLAIAQGHLNPTLHFDSLEYQYPATVVLSNVLLTAEGVDFVQAASMRIEFTEVPKSGQPIVIQTVELTDPVVKLIRTSSDQLIGFNNFIRRQADRTPPESEKPAATPRLSDVFAIRRIGVINGSVEYQVPDQPPMRMDQLTFDLTSEPSVQRGSADAGWYALNAIFARASLFDFKIDARLNVDSAMLILNDAALAMKLNPDQYSILPPQVQSIVRDHEIVGDLIANISGDLPLRRGAGPDLKIQTTLRNGNISFGDYVLPTESLRIASRLTNAALSIDPMIYKGLGGEVQLSGTVQLENNYPVAADVAVRGIRIENALRNAGAESPRFAGQVVLNGKITADLADPSTSAGGSGVVNVDRGRLVNIPLISQLIRAASLGSNGGEANDRGSAEWKLAGDRVQLNAIDVTSGPLAARGEGEIGFNSTLNLRFNAGPLERIQNELGKIGELFGKVTDKLVSYYVTGTFDQPSVSVRAFGLGGKGE